MSSATDNIRQIFSDEYVREKCFSLWEAHLQWLHECGFERALQVDSNPVVPCTSTGHEVVDLLALFVQSTGLVNAHLGLTSSDVIDNVRLMQVNASVEVIHTRLFEMVGWFQSRLDVDEDTVGFTHWQPAAPITWRHRMRAWLEPIELLLERRPQVHAKQFGGPVGDARSLRRIVSDVKTFEWSHFHLAYPANQFPIQSSDHLDELAAVGWCCVVAAQVHKIAQDLRFLASRRTIVIGRKPDHAGSSSMPHKTNPYKWEKVCSCCRSLSTTHQEVWSVMAHNSLERTLDTSWQLKHALQRCFETLAIALDEMLAVEFEVHVSNTQVETMLSASDIASDARLMERILGGGESRWFAYLSMLNHTNQQHKRQEKTKS